MSEASATPGFDARNPWIVTRRPRPDATLRLICVPNAGAGMLTFRTWVDLAPWIEVGVVQLPGRDARRSEPCCRSIGEAAEAIASAAMLDERPLVLFGHSMGALIAFEVTRKLRASGRMPVALVATGRRGPSCRDRFEPIAGLPRAQFLRQAQGRYGGIPEDVLRDEELADLLVPVLHADMAMVEGYTYQPAAPLSLNLFVGAGLADAQTTPEEIEAWKTETRGLQVVRWFPGGHFFIESAKADVQAAVIDFLATVRPQRI